MALPQFEDICHPNRCPAPEALAAARRMAASESAFDSLLAETLGRELIASAKVDLPVVERLLELLAEVAPPSRLFPALRSALSHADPHVRSKAALLLGRKVENAELLMQLATDGDPRVRANTVQALWGRKDPTSRQLFERALEDLHHRGAANAAYGLFLIDPAGHPDRLARFIRHPHPRFRRAGAWILRKIGDPHNLNLLQALMSDKNAEVRNSAFAAMVALRHMAGKQDLALASGWTTPA